jgi:hypothetical protein
MKQLVIVGKGKKAHILYGSILTNGYTFCRLGSPIPATRKDLPLCKTCDKSYKGMAMIRTENNMNKDKTTLLLQFKALKPMAVTGK